MTRKLAVVGLSAMLCSAAAWAQATASNTETTVEASSAPVAYIYVSSTPKNSSNDEVEGYAAAASGKLTAIAGSPFEDDISSIAANGKYLFGANAHGTNIDSYAIEANGALRFATSTDYTKYNSDDCGRAGSLFLDHTGSSLYVLEYDGNSCANNSYQSFGVNKSTGGLENLGSGVASGWLDGPASFIGNNEYAYSAACISNMYWQIYGLKRGSTGKLNQVAINAATPKPKEGDFFCPSMAAADPTDHVAMVLQAVKQQDFRADGAAQLVSFTAGSTGNLSTANTVANMPTTEAGTVTALNMSPSGKLLAVAGSGGLQIFHFNGAGAISKDTGLLTTDAIQQIYWDKANHLYAISQTAGKLFVFTVTATSASQAPGSPYAVSSPQGLVVQPLP